VDPQNTQIASVQNENDQNICQNELKEVAKNEELKESIDDREKKGNAEFNKEHEIQTQHKQSELPSLNDWDTNEVLNELHNTKSWQKDE